MTPEEELFEVRYNNWMYHLWTDFVTPPDSWCPLDLNMARTPGIRSAHITNMLTKLHHITWCPFFPKIKSSTITYLLIKIRVVIRKKGVMWEKFPSGGPPPAPPSLGIFTFFLPFFKIFFCDFISPWIGKNREKYGVGLGQTPPPVWEFSPHNPVFFLKAFLSCQKITLTWIRLHYCRYWR